MLQTILEDGLSLVMEEAQRMGVLAALPRTSATLAKESGLDWLFKTPEQVQADVDAEDAEVENKSAEEEATEVSNNGTQRPAPSFNKLSFNPVLFLGRFVKSRVEGAMLPTRALSSQQSAGPRTMTFASSGPACLDVTVAAVKARFKSAIDAEVVALGAARAAFALGEGEYEEGHLTEAAAGDSAVEAVEDGKRKAGGKSIMAAFLKAANDARWLRCSAASEVACLEEKIDDDISFMVDPRLGNCGKTHADAVGQWLLNERAANTTSGRQVAVATAVVDLIVTAPLSTCLETTQRILQRLRRDPSLDGDAAAAAVPGTDAPLPPYLATNGGNMTTAVAVTPLHTSTAAVGKDRHPLPALWQTRESALAPCNRGRSATSLAAEFEPQSSPSSAEPLAFGRHKWDLSHLNDRKLWRCSKKELVPADENNDTGAVISRRGIEDDSEDGYDFGGDVPPQSEGFYHPLRLEGQRGANFTEWVTQQVSQNVLVVGQPDALAHILGVPAALLLPSSSSASSPPAKSGIVRRQVGSQYSWAQSFELAEGKMAEYSFFTNFAETALPFLAKQRGFLSFALHFEHSPEGHDPHAAMLLSSSSSSSRTSPPQNTYENDDDQLPPMYMSWASPLESLAASTNKSSNEDNNGEGRSSDDDGDDGGDNDDSYGFSGVSRQTPVEGVLHLMWANDGFADECNRTPDFLQVIGALFDNRPSTSSGGSEEKIPSPSARVEGEDEDEDDKGGEGDAAPLTVEEADTKAMAARKAIRKAEVAKTAKTRYQARVDKWPLCLPGQGKHLLAMAQSSQGNRHQHRKDSKGQTHGAATAHADRNETNANKEDEEKGEGDEQSAPPLTPDNTHHQHRHHPHHNHPLHPPSRRGEIGLAVSRAALHMVMVLKSPKHALQVRRKYRSRLLAPLASGEFPGFVQCWLEVGVSVAAAKTTAGHPDHDHGYPPVRITSLWESAAARDMATTWWNREAAAVFAPLAVPSPPLRVTTGRSVVPNTLPNEENEGCYYVGDV